MRRLDWIFDCINMFMAPLGVVIGCILFVAGENQLQRIFGLSLCFLQSAYWAALMVRKFTDDI